MHGAKEDLAQYSSLGSKVQFTKVKSSHSQSLIYLSLINSQAHSAFHHLQLVNRAIEWAVINLQSRYKPYYNNTTQLTLHGK